MFTRLVDWYCEFSRLTDKVAAGFTVVLVTLFTLVVLLQIFMRYVLSNALPWPEEFARYALVWVTFIAGSCALRRGDHVGIDFFVEMLPSLRLRALIKLIIVGILTFLFITMIYYGVDLASRASGRTTPGMGISQGWFHTGLIIGVCFMVVQSIEHGLRAALALVDPDASAARAEAITSSDPV
ncbi:TRAP transporter small permease [Fodinicurvata sp. EGI_FJ10296]|uniref:TRAP transporter small permease n=1 Tax=Fodinicurvata sp. EGI_FJ10296 TaxID=3231908 RepID=UPI0034572931